MKNPISINHTSKDGPLIAYRVEQGYDGLLSERLVVGEVRARHFLIVAAVAAIPLPIHTAVKAEVRSVLRRGSRFLAATSVQVVPGAGTAFSAPTATGRGFLEVSVVSDAGISTTLLCGGEPPAI